ncbi:MAG: hypothetical protein HY731_04925 [Candidatus Tectomicrobia bacterium]|nr:hypothetical protein [Candidatus Tectomicrobia bacterium]
MRKATKRTDEKYIEVGYADKVIFTPEKKAKSHPDIITAWQKSQGLWADHPVFQGMTVKEVIEWLRGEDCDV